MRKGAIILAGGTGSRFGAAVPKQFAPLCGKPILLYSIEAFLPASDVIVIVSHPDWMEQIRSLISIYPNILLTEGGETRQVSVYWGLSALTDRQLDVVAIHDGARPLVSLSLIKESFKTAFEKGSAIPVIPCPQTMCRVSGKKIKSYENRDSLFAIQTPQSFRFDLIFKAHQKALENKRTDYTDDSQLFEILKLETDTIDGEEANIKITDPFDLLIASSLIHSRKMEDSR